MTTNITQGNSAQFVVDFYDPTTGLLVTPSSASLSIVYTSVAGSTAATTIAMTRSGSSFTATWGTSVAAYGLAQWSTTGTGQTVPTTGTLRLLDP